jgi:hypothetical protein
MMKQATKGSIAIRAVAAAAIFSGRPPAKTDRDAVKRVKTGKSAARPSADGEAGAAATAVSGKAPNR